MGAKMDRQRILVVEDHRPLLSAIRDVLEAGGYGVLTAIDGIEALEIMEESRPDLIVADIMMPRMNGYDLYEAVRTRPEWIPIPFIFLTARAAKEDVLKGKGLGAEDYIIKPFDPQELLVAIQARLGRAQAIREATEAEFDYLKQQIINVLSHELRTPLTYIQGYTSLALEDIHSPDSLQAFLTSIKRGADRLTRLVEDMLLVIQIDTGQTAKDFEMLAGVHHDLGEVVERTVKKLKEQAQASGVALEVELPSSFPPIRLCEPFFIEALGRLIDNGIKFSKHQEKRVTVSGQVQNGWIEIAVQDRGVGIAPEEIPHLFERFRQINREKMEQQGIGLGLAIAKDFIGLHGGEIVVESALEEGSTFTIRLPVTDKLQPTT
jgi:two-component system sensor histidine kinase/response regulator